MPATSILRDPEAVRDAVSRSQSIKEALVLLGLRAAGGNYRALREACARIGMEVPRWQVGPPIGRPFDSCVPDELVFCENSTYLNRDQIKARLLRRGMPECCAECSIGPKWNGRPLKLQLDHINGVFNDNRSENLRLLCPNCHSQTETFSGRKRRVAIVPCSYCENLNRPGAQRCSSCRRWFVRQPGRCKIEWPGDEELRRMVAASSFVSVGRKLGVSDTAVHKRLKRAGKT